MSAAEPVIPGTDIPIAELVAVFLSGQTIAELADQFELDAAAVKQALRGELRVLLWLHGHEDRPEAEEQEPETDQTPAPPAPAAPLPAIPRPAHPLTPTPTRPPIVRPLRPAAPRRDQWRLPPGHRGPTPRWSPGLPDRPHIGDPPADGRSGIICQASTTSRVDPRAYRNLLARVHQRAAELDAEQSADTPWRALSDGR